ncbi:MAG TPA: GatB/YqeY domain-containing protein [Terriglobales bacterium]|jgi:hypothetical protein
MSLSERIQQDMVAAMKARAELRLATLRMVKTAIKNKEIELRHPLDDPQAEQVLVTLIKQREDSAAQFQAGGRAELAQRERQEIGVIEEYLPQALPAAAVEEGVRAAIAATIAAKGAVTPKDMGVVMKAAMAQFQARQQRVDGKLVSEIVKRLLTPVPS